ASVVIIHLCFAKFIAEVMASFFGDLVLRSFLITAMSVRVSRCNRDVSRTCCMIFADSSSEASSTKIISYKCLGYFNLKIDSNKTGKFSASFLKGTIIEKVVSETDFFNLKLFTL